MQPHPDIILILARQAAEHRWERELQLHRSAPLEAAHQQRQAERSLRRDRVRSLLFRLAPGLADRWA